MKLRIQRCLIPLTILLLITGASSVFGQPRPSRPNTEKDRIAVITKFLTARTSGDYELARTFLAPDSRIWFGDKEGEGGQWTVPGRWTNWDRYFNGKVTYSDWTVTSDSVTANGVEINDFYRLIDRPAQPLKTTWWFDKNGHMTGFLFEPVRANESDKDKLADFEKWAKRNNPEELKYLMPDGQIDPTGDRPARWRTILANWRKAAGLREIASVPRDIRHFSQGIPNENSAPAFSVGFKTLLTVDHSRSYKLLSRPEAGGRPIRLFIWYSTRRSKPGPSLRFADYVYSQSLEKEKRQLTSAERSSFDKKLAETLEFFNVGAEQVKDLMKAETNASWNAPEIKGKFPLLVLGNVGEGFYYSAMAEYLAANGYKLKWGQLFGSAIKHAEDGFVVGERNAAAIKNAFSSFPEHAKKFYGTNGYPLKASEKLIQKDLAKTFRAIAARGAKDATNGEIAKAIDAAMRDAKGFLALKDLQQNKAEWWQPISIDYRGHKIVTASPPANSFDMLVRLGLMSRFDVASLGHNSVEFLHRFAEVTKIGFRVRLDHAADPDIKAVPLDWLLSSAYWKQEAENIDLQKARPFARSDGGSSKQTHTTHFVVADRWGNVVSATQTLGNLFGSRIMPPGTGVWLNNSLEYSTFEPKGNPMDAFPGRHKLSGDCPTFIFRDGKLWAALGTPGGHTIGQTVPQMVMNLIDFRMNIQHAIAAPRISFIEPDKLAVEAAVGESVRSSLAAMGHDITVVRALGNAHGLTIEYGRSVKPVGFAGGADPRGEGAAASP